MQLQNATENMTRSTRSATRPDITVFLDYTHLAIHKAALNRSVSAPSLDLGTGLAT